MHFKRQDLAFISDATPFFVRIRGLKRDHGSRAVAHIPAHWKSALQWVGLRDVPTKDRLSYDDRGGENVPIGKR